MRYIISYEFFARPTFICTSTNRSLLCFQIRFVLQFSPFSRYHREYLFSSRQTWIERSISKARKRATWMIRDIRDIAREVHDCATRFHAKHVKSWRRLLTHVYTQPLREGVSFRCWSLSFRLA